jgi:hypothetical protein
MANHRALWLGIALFAARVAAECTCKGLDYTNGGAYFIDRSSTANFQFISYFEGMS